MKHAAYQLNFIDYILHQHGHKQAEFERSNAEQKAYEIRLERLKKQTVRYKLESSIKVLKAVNSHKLSEYGRKCKKRSGV